MGGFPRNQVDHQVVAVSFSQRYYRYIQNCVRVCFILKIIIILFNHHNSFLIPFLLVGIEPKPTVTPTTADRQLSDRAKIPNFLLQKSPEIIFTHN